MSAVSLSELRRTLREQFPDAHQERSYADTYHLPGLPPLPKGSITELVTPPATSGATLLISHLLESPPPTANSSSSNSSGNNFSGNSSPTHPHQTSAPPPSQLPLVLIDPSNAFDPCAYSPTRPFLWLKPRDPDNSLKAADLLLRDGNLPLLLLDLALIPPTRLRRIPSSSWYRLRTLAETSGTSLLALTPAPLIAAAPARHHLQSSFTLAHLSEIRRDLTLHLQTQPLHHLSNNQNKILNLKS
ncbi:MAG: hypothetical protein Q7Q71_09250 [Verrucomicrobiota bacterium JB023]|nr:hypothetical protein [Verrucomicrobiota bacterium JB023]